MFDEKTKLGRFAAYVAMFSVFTILATIACSLLYYLALFTFTSTFNDSLPFVVKFLFFPLWTMIVAFIIKGVDVFLEEIKMRRDRVKQSINFE